jgi:hypothetical protein
MISPSLAKSTLGFIDQVKNDFTTKDHVLGVFLSKALTLGVWESK